LGLWQIGQAAGLVRHGQEPVNTFESHA
jgi:hypothetical protein